MSSATFILLGITYYIISIIIIVVVLNIINSKEKNKYKDIITKLERDKNLIISAGILTELNKVQGLVNSPMLQEMYDDWNVRFKSIKEKEIPRITDDLIEIENLFDEKNYKELNKRLAKAEFDIYYIKTKSCYLLNEIKEITLSEGKNRETITKLKTKYRKVITKYNNNKDDYQLIMGPIELQFENVDKLFSAFEVSMEKNDFQNIGKIVKALDTIIGNLSLVIEEAPSIINIGTKLLPIKMKDVCLEGEKLKKDGYNIDYLKLEYNCDEANKKIKECLEKLNVLNIEDSSLELKTLLDYFDGLYNDFDKEKVARKIFEEYIRTILVNANKFERIVNDLSRKTKEFKYSYDLTDEDLVIIDVIKEELKLIKGDYDKIVKAHRSKNHSYSRLAKKMEELNVRLSKTEEKLDYAIKTLGSLKEDEIRAREQLDEIKEILIRAKEKINSYNLPVIPKNYFVELAEATDAIKEMIKELEKNPISIKVLNIRVDTARDLVLKVYNTSKEIVKTAYMAEMSVVYGNRYRVIDDDIDIELTKAELLFNKGEFKKSLEVSINAINMIEPDYYEKLVSNFDK